MDDSRQPEIGIHRDVDRTTYESWDRARVSSLKLFDRTCAHARYAMTHPKDTKALTIGDATHAAILEPQRFEAEYVQGLDLPRRKNVDKEAHAAFDAEHASQVVLKKDEWDLCLTMREAVRLNPTALELLTAPGYTELSLAWECLGVACKGRTDRYTTLGGWPVIADAKTLIDATRKGFERWVEKYHWHVQAAFYLDGLDAISPNPSRRFMFICIEKSPPYCTQVFELDAGSIDQGRRDYRKWLRQWAECEKNQAWPGYPGGVNDAELPRWAFRYDEDDDEENYS